MQHKDARILDLACGQCIGCRLERSRQWAVRCIHEASMYDENCFITLTYSDENLPWDGSLRKTDFQKFMKRLRKHYDEKTIRYFHCGEYGEQTLRPHYHALLFNHDFDDRELWSERDGISVYRSETLERIWPLGQSTIGELNFETAAYTARYCMKKITGKNLEKIDPETGLKPYERMHVQTGELITVQPEYVSMSLKPGIGKTWYDEFKADCYPSDFITHKGKKFRVPKYYDKLYQQEDPEGMEGIKRSRTLKGWEHKDDQTKERLEAREKCASARLAKLIRPYE